MREKWLFSIRLSLQVGARGWYEQGRILSSRTTSTFHMLRIYFNGQGYEVQVPRARRGADDHAQTASQPDRARHHAAGHERLDVCRELRTTVRTSNIPIIFLTQKDERSDKIAGLWSWRGRLRDQALDIEELKLRVQNAIGPRAARRRSIPSRISRPAALIEDHLRDLMHSEGRWDLPST